MRLPTAAIIVIISTACAAADTLPTCVEVTIEPQRFGDTSSILQVDSTVATFRFDRPVQHLALVLESRPKEPRTARVARLSLELAKPVTEGRLCVQMADQGFIPLGNGSPNQMQLFMQMDCGGTLISSSQSFLKEKFNFSRSRARTGAGTLTRKVVDNRAPVFWLMGNSDNGTYFNDDDLDKMVSKNRDAYVLIAYLEVAREAPAQAPTPTVVQVPDTTSPPAAVARVTEAPKPLPAAAEVSPSVMATAFTGPPFPVPPMKEEGRSSEVKIVEPTTKPKSTTTASSAASKTSKKPTSTKSSKSTSSSSKKKKKS